MQPLARGEGPKPFGPYFNLNALGLGAAQTFPKDGVASTRTVVDKSLTFNF